MFPVAAAAHLADTTEGRKAWLWLTVQGTQSIAVGRQGWWGSKSCSMLSTWKERAQIRKWGHSSCPQVLPSPTVAHFPPEAYLRKFLQPSPQTAPSTGDPGFKHIDLGGTLSAPMGYYLVKPVVMEVFPVRPYYSNILAFEDAISLI